MPNEPHPIMAMLLESNSFVGLSETVEDEIRPLPAQLDFGPGDAALLASANTPLERDFRIVRGVDPRKHAETYPDWEERMAGTAANGWNSHVLCEGFSKFDPVMTLGWYSRLKLLPITNYRWRQTKRWIEDGFPDPIPEWCEEIYVKYTDQLSESAPERVPRAATCPNCGNHNVELIVNRRINYKVRAGTLTIEGKVVHMPVHEPDETSTHSARLHCTGCNSFADLEDDEWQLPGITN